MSAPARLALYGLGLVVAFGASYGLADLLVPDTVVESWTERAEQEDHGSGHDEPAGADHGG